ncbi:Pleckstrin homology domain-containing protein [Paraphoma chrysanthemicola]|nr:Pleckstrin homology domain-containing protein [Paraphoma chrysanthemicola]
MSAVEAQKTTDVPVVGSVDPAPAPVEPVKIDNFVTPTEGATPATEEPKAATEEATPAPAAVEEKKDEVKPEVKVAEPIYSGALGYKAPGLKNAFRYSKKYFWFGEESVPASNLREYLRGEKPEIAHGVAAWSSQTGKGLLYFVKHADQKENPAGVLNLAYADNLHKDGTVAFAFKISGHKHAFEAQTAPERDGWFVAVEKAIAEAKEAKEGIESSEGYKEQKEKIGKPTTLAAATASSSTPKKSTDATPKPVETEPVAEGSTAVAPVRTGSSSSSSSDEEKKAKKSKSKSRSASRKRASIFGGLLGKKDKAEEKAEQKKEEHKAEGEAAKTEPEVKKDEAPIVPVTEIPVTAPVITQDIPKAGEELKTEAAPAPAVGAAVEESKPVESSAKVDEKPKPTKRGSIFGTFFEKVKSPTHEKKEHEVAPPVPAKETETAPAASKPLEEAQVAVPATVEPVQDSTTLKTDEAKPSEPKPTSTPTKEKAHFQFGKFFGGSKDRSKSPAATDKAPAPAEPSKVDEVAPQIEDTTVPAAPKAEEPVVAAPVTETKVESTTQDKKDETPAKKEKRGSIFGSLGRSLSKATSKKDTAAKKETTPPTTVPETAEPKDDKVAVPAVEDKKETPAVAAPAENSIGDVVPEAVTVGEAPKSNPTVSTTA